ncbi:class I adenylate-forming enzyme family protein [Prauserella cavernicola]|uniref:Acyl--CoA ligase n=1 Tax=Prauserella cavernicola TaxID=2800127 RepID=A0A934V7K9_9PSEU|nr:class I adenylate-forming enzyme family protein [Prauserella cavernicola]MBK1787809.1 acyl--CoA ligase [Prauserella cavernicola]
MTAASFAERVEQALHEHAEHGRVALSGTFGQVSYRDLAERVARAAATIHSWDLPHASVLGIAAPKSPEGVAAFLGALRAGVCASFLEPRLGPRATEERMRLFGIERVLVGGTGDFSVPDAAARPLDELFSASHRSSPLPYPANGNHAMMLFTSGSTGQPKAIKLTHANLRANADGVLERTALGPDDRLLHLMPVHHTNGVNNQLIAPLLAGSEITLVERFDAAALPAQLAQHDPTIVTGVPTMYLRALEHLPDDYRPRRLRFLRCGSAPITPEQQARIEAAFDVPLVLSYGLSEATCTSTMNPPGLARPGSVGTALAGQRIGIFAPGGDTLLGTGKEGEVRIAGPTLMSGYVGGEDNPVRDGWLHTGDLGRLDAEGYLTISGRIKDVIIRGGENLAPGAIEAVLARHSGVAHCAVVGAEHPDLGQVPHAYVVPAGDSDPPSENELREHVRAELSRAYVPERVSLLTELPLNPVGKIDRAALRRRS